MKGVAELSYLAWWHPGIVVASWHRGGVYAALSLVRGLR